MGRLALISVTDKTGIVDFARQLTEEFDFEIISSGGTAKTLQSAGIPVIKVGEYTGSPEILGGRVKTLHPRIHGGILARRDWQSDLAEMEANQIRPFDLVVVNLYPFEQTIANPDVTTAQAIEQIDIGGPAMLRASAKNFAHLTVISNPKYYEQYLSQLRQNNGEISLEFRQKMAGETFALTNAYDGAIAAYFASLNGETTRFNLAGNALQTLRYGENPHQSATWYGSGTMAQGWGKATLLQGKELSYNNLVDLEAARRLIAELDTATFICLEFTNQKNGVRGELIGLSRSGNPYSNPSILTAKHNSNTKDPKGTNSTKETNKKSRHTTQCRAKRYKRKEVTLSDIPVKQNRFHTMQCCMHNFGFCANAKVSLQKNFNTALSDEPTGMHLQPTNLTFHNFIHHTSDLYKLETSFFHRPEEQTMLENPISSQLVTRRLFKPFLPPIWPTANV